MVFLDSSVWIAFLNNQDSQNQKSISIFKNIEKEYLEINDYVFSESLTVFRYKKLEKQCKNLIRFLKDFNINFNISDNQVLALANYYFFKYQKLSFVDCQLLASSKINDAELITFDKELQKAWNLVKSQP